MCLIKANEDFNLSLAGCGFLSIYHLGVVSCFQEYCPKVLTNCISGASTGALIGCAVACGLSPVKGIIELINLMEKIKSNLFGPIYLSFTARNILVEALRKSLPEDAHLRVSGKLRISLTRVKDRKNVIVSEFDSKEDLIQALFCSCFIPFVMSVPLLPPKYKGVAYMDGALSENLIIVDNSTITVSPWSGDADICPRRATSSSFQICLLNTNIDLTLENIYKGFLVAYPLVKSETLLEICQSGYDDAFDFIKNNNSFQNNNQAKYED